MTSGNRGGKQNGQKEKTDSADYRDHNYRGHDHTDDHLGDAAVSIKLQWEESC